MDYNVEVLFKSTFKIETASVTKVLIAPTSVTYRRLLETVKSNQSFPEIRPQPCHDNWALQPKYTQQDNVEVLGDSSLGIGPSSTHRRNVNARPPPPWPKKASKKKDCCSR